MSRPSAVAMGDASEVFGLEFLVGGRERLVGGSGLQEHGLLGAGTVPIEC